MRTIETIVGLMLEGKLTRDAGITELNQLMRGSRMDLFAAAALNGFLSNSKSHFITTDSFAVGAIDQAKKMIELMP